MPLPNNTYFLDKETEADTCRKFVLPKLYESDWTNEQIAEQRYFTAGKIIISGRKGRRTKAKRTDYLLRYTTNFPLAVVEAKASYKTAADGLEQAKEYAQLLGLKFAYATNGIDIIEFDFATGLQTSKENFPTPSELLQRWQEQESCTPKALELLIKPLRPNPDKPLRYYQEIAINRALQAILSGRKRLLLTLATGTGKTSVAFQIAYKLWENRWNRNGEHRRPKILFLADRGVLVDEPHNKDFAVFGEARCIMPDNGFPTSREMYFSTYQALAEDANREGAFRKFPPNFFDLIIIDECHRGSASDESSWRAILDYFTGAVQLGLTATPLRDDNKDTYEYFGNPLYTYSLKQGIADGFLAPYLLHRIVTNIDATGFRAESGAKDIHGQELPDSEFTTRDFEITLSHLPRTKAVAKHLSEFMHKHGRFDKTIVFCVDSSHAADFAREFGNLNADLMREYPNYVSRITAKDGEAGKGLLSAFMDIEQDTPVVVTTSKLLSTGVDIPTCKNIVIFRMVGSMTEFKQIVGRGTRTREDRDKLFFTMLDYTGSASRNFADAEFDGEPPHITNQVIDDEGNITTTEEQQNDDENNDGQSNDGNTDGNEGGGNNPPPNPPPRPKYRIEEGSVTIVAESVQILDENGKLRTLQFQLYAKERVLAMMDSADILRSHWQERKKREDIIERLKLVGIDIQHLTELTGKTDADPFDILCYVAFDLKPKTRRERAELLKRNKPDFFKQYSAQAQEILGLILEKYVEEGAEQLTPKILKVQPLQSKGNTTEITKMFGGVEQLQSAINQLQTLLYSAVA